MKENFALIMKGGGIKGLAYVGALKELCKYFEFNHYVGTSAGAISAVLLGGGYSLIELEKIMKQTNFERLVKSNIFDRIRNIFLYRGLHHAKLFEEWIQEILSIRLDEELFEVRMCDLPRNVTIYASTRNRKAIIFNSRNSNSDNSVAFAVRCSMSIPYYFTPQKIEGFNVYDGGVQNNYPVDIFLESNPTYKDKFIGLYLGGKFKRHGKSRLIFFDILSILTDAVNVELLREYRNETIKIDTFPISTLKFNLSDYEKDFLLDCGRISALRYLKNIEKIDIKTDLIEQEQKLKKKRDYLLKLENKRKRKYYIFIIFLAVLLGVLYSINLSKKRPSVSDELILTGYKLIQNDKSKCKIPDYIAEKCLNGDSRLISVYDQYQEFITQNSIEELPLSAENLKNLLNYSENINEIDLKIKLEKIFSAENGLIGFKLVMGKDSSTNFKIPRILNMKNWRYLKKNMQSPSEFLYTNEIGKDSPLIFTVLKIGKK